jgi:hypothetical protein
MTPELVALAHRAVACKGWRWMGGMQLVHPPTKDGSTGYYFRVPQDNYVSLPSEYPDLADPATLGCLLHLVREAHKCPQAHVYWATVTRLWVVRWGAARLGEHTVEADEAEALVRALEAANELL